MALISNTTLTEPPYVPLYYTEAMSSEDAHLWRPLIEVKYASHIKNGMGKHLATPIKAKWVFKVSPGHKDVPLLVQSSVRGERIHS